MSITNRISFSIMKIIYTHWFSIRSFAFLKKETLFLSVLCVSLLCNHSAVAYSLSSKYLKHAADSVVAEAKGTIKGKIKTVDGKPAAYVSVALAGTAYGASTNGQGIFHFQAPAGNYQLVVSSVGLEKKEIEVVVTARETINLADITLNVSAQELGEVIVQSSYAGNDYKVSEVSSTLRLQTPILETAQNIQVVSTQLLADQQIFDMLEGVSRNVSGVTMVEHWGNYARLNMRGSKIAPFRNGMNVEMPWGPLAEDMSMVERIEFVKGPAGFMLANGEPSGFYNVVTKKPTGIKKGEATLALGSYDTYRATLDLDGKLSDNGKLLYRINLMGQLEGAHRDYEFNNRYSVVPVITYKINDQTSLTAEYTYQYSQMSAIGAAYVFAPDGYGGLPVNFTTAEPNLDPSEINDHSIFLTLNHQLAPDWQLTAQLAYFNYRQQGSSLWPLGVDAEGNMQRGVSIWDAFNESKLGQVFVNGEVQTGAVRHSLLAGLDMSYKNYMADWNQGFALNGSEPFNIYNPIHGVPADSLPVFDRSKSLRYRAGANIIGQSYQALYVQDELHFWNDRLRLTLAGRYTSVDGTQYGATTDEQKFTPRVGVSVSLTPQTSVYGLYDQAFVPQTGTDFSGKAFDPITGNNVEGGIKKDWFDGRWNSTVSVYQITKNNVLTADPEHVNFSVQLGQTQTMGVEFDVQGEVLPGLNLMMNYAYTNSEITKDTNEENIGKPVAGFAKHITNAWLSYKLREGALQGLGFSLGYQWQADRSTWAWAAETQKTLPDYFRMDGSVSWQSNQFSVALNVNNLLNKYLFSGSPYSTFYYWQTEAPRNFRLSIGYKF